MTIVEFLQARLAEDERDALDAEPGPWWTANSGADWGEHEDHYVEAGGERVCTVVGNSDENGSNADHIARWHPQRALAETELKTQILREHGWAVGRTCDRCTTDRETVRTPCRTIRALALPYADHPDYDERWKP